VVDWVCGKSVCLSIIHFFDTLVWMSGLGGVLNFE
jgi:hypothetical protein